VGVLGKTSADCIRTGVLRGEALSVCGFYDLYVKEYGLPEDTPLVISGVYAEYLLPYLPEHTQHIPLLALKGLCEIHRINRGRRS
jgi:pantothenate kinase type III